MKENLAERNTDALPEDEVHLMVRMYVCLDRNDVFMIHRCAQFQAQCLTCQVAGD